MLPSGPLDCRVENHNDRQLTGSTCLPHRPVRWMAIHCYDSVQGQRERDLGSQWSGWGGSHILPSNPCCRLPAGSPLLVCIQRACELFGGYVCVCVFTSMEKKCGDVNTLLLELPFLKLLCLRSSVRVLEKGPVFAGMGFLLWVWVTATTLPWGGHNCHISHPGETGTLQAVCVWGVLIHRRMSSYTHVSISVSGSGLNCIDGMSILLEQDCELY